MFADRKARIGLLGLMFKLYDRWPEVKPVVAGFAREIATAMSPFAEVDFPGVCDTPGQVSEAVARFERGGADMVVVLFLTYCPSHVALPALQRTRLPILILNTQQLQAVDRQIREVDLTYNHGMHGVQDLANVLLRAGRSFHIVTGSHWDAGVMQEVRDWCDAARTAAGLRQSRIALLGHQMPQMGDIAIDETALLAQLGVTVERVPLRVVAERAAAAPTDALEAQMAADRREFEVEPGIPPEEHEASARLEWAIRALLQEGRYDGWSPYFGAFDEDQRVETLPFLAACKLLGEGYAFGAEGDVTAAAAMCIMDGLAGPAGFTEMFTMDLAGNGVLMNHMGEGNYRLARTDQRVRLRRRPFALVDLKPPLLLWFAHRPGPVTLASLTTVANGRLKLIIAQGEVADFPPIEDITSPHWKYLPDKPLGEFLTRFSEEGGSHHQALAYGHVASKVVKLARLLGLEYAVV